MQEGDMQESRHAGKQTCESPRDLWGRDAGAPRSLLSLSGSACAAAGAVTQRGRYRPRTAGVNPRAEKQ
jgi:hypothetical protein